MVPDKLPDLSFIPEVTKEKKKRRCGPKPGIGGFIARQRKPSSKPRSTSTDSEDLRMTEAAMSGEAADGAEASKHSGKHDKQKRKRRTKNVSELEQKFPSYIQEAFFGKSLLDQSKEKTDGTSLSGEDINPSLQTSINISDKMKNSDSKTGGLGDPKQQTPGQDSDLGGGDDPLNFIPHAEIINMLIGDNLEKTDPTSLTMPSVEGDEQTSQPQPQGNTDASAQSNNPDQIEELESILNSNLVQMVPEDDLVHMDGKEVEDLLSGVLSPNEQNQQHSSGASNNLPPSSAAAAAPPPHHPVLPGRPHPPKLPSLPNIIPSTKSTSQGSDVTSPAFSPDYSEPPSPWPGLAEGGSSQDSSTSQSTKRLVLEVKADSKDVAECDPG
ncbi:putative histone-lysine N-methyltransferase 2C isoform X4 [Apostichopus japonicus]|uniref:Putative histone-lysine N-methyltransferase 2C isoform X4 n=1 Tax=Stichopus japonicus TaxID=307972 RepID=A0A2G8JVA4_STIJA|nr:putative histone-lysine N-methyltransferase 2C isoform X4 [Apostichopus japonicus]